MTPQIPAPRTAIQGGGGGGGLRLAMPLPQETRTVLRSDAGTRSLPRCPPGGWSRSSTRRSEEDGNPAEPGLKGKNGSTRISQFFY